MNTFSASVIPGSGRGKTLGFPTLNLQVVTEEVEISDGVYACFVRADDFDAAPAVMHIGSRPTHDDTPSCEVHLIDTELPTTPSSISVEVVENIRSVRKFNSSEELSTQIHADIQQARAILNAS